MKKPKFKNRTFIEIQKRQVIFCVALILFANWKTSVMVFVYLCCILSYFYFKNKSYRKMINSLNIGDKIICNDGVFCEILEIQLEYFIVKISDDNTAKLHKDFVLRKFQ